MRKISFTLIFLFFTIIISFAQAPTIQWQKTYGGSAGDDGYSIVQTFDGGYIATGWSASNDGDITNRKGFVDIWVIKIDAIGNLQWQKSLGGSDVDNGFSIIQSTDSNYIITGAVLSIDSDVIGNHGLEDVWVVKLGQAGNIIWKKAYGGSSYDEPSQILQTMDGGYILAGYSNSNNLDVTGHHGSTSYADAWILKIDAFGNIQWEKSYGGSTSDNANSIIQLSDGGYVFVGWSNSWDGDLTFNYGNSDYWVVRINSVGNIIWKKVYGGGSADIANSITKTNNGYLIAGYSNSTNGDITNNHGIADVWVLNIDTLGNIIWQKSYGGSSMEVGYNINKLIDGNFIITGNSSSNDFDVTVNHGNSDYWVLKIDPTGNIIWQKSLGGLAMDEAYASIQSNDGGIVVIGESYSDDGDITFNHGTAFANDDYWIVKLFPEITSVEPEIQTDVSIFPNPSSDEIEIKFENGSLINNTYFEFTDILGNKIYSSFVNSKDFSIDISSFPKGIYFLKFTCDNRSAIKKIVKI